MLPHRKYKDIFKDTFHLRALNRLIHDDCLQTYNDTHEVILICILCLKTTEHFQQHFTSNTIGPHHICNIFNFYFTKTEIILISLNLIVLRVCKFFLFYELILSS